jgi:hypothetical protein
MGVHAWENKHGITAQRLLELQNKRLGKEFKQKID